MITRFLYFLHCLFFFKKKHRGISETAYLFPCSREIVGRYLTQLGPTEEANPETDNASMPFQQKVETDAISKAAVSVWKQAYGQGPQT